MNWLCKLFGHKWDLSYKVEVDIDGAKQKYKVESVRQLSHDQVDLNFILIKKCKRCNKIEKELLAKGTKQ